MIVDGIKILIDGLLVGLASSVTVGPVAVLCIQRTLSRGYISGLFSGFGVASADTLMAILAFTLYALLKDYIDAYNNIIMSCGGIFVIVVGIFIFFKNPVPQVRKNRTGKNALWQDFASMFGFTLANFAIIIPYILAFFTMFNVDLSNGNNAIEPKVESVAQISNEDYLSDADGMSYSDEFMAKDQHGIIAKHKELKEAEAKQRAEEAANAANATPESEYKIPRFIRTLLVLVGFLVGAMIWWGGLTSLINLFRRDFKPRHLIMINRIAGIIIAALGIYTIVSVIITL